MEPLFRSARASAPARIDLAGGTLDIWPLNLLVDHAVTVNVAIDRRAEVEVGPEPGTVHRLVAEDIGREVLLPFGPGDAGPGECELPLHAEVIRCHAPARPLRLSSRSGVPAGSGLGGSSALAVAMIGALRASRGEAIDPERIAPLARDLEARILQVPTGTQDHLAALHGGFAAIHYGPGETRREPLAVDADRFESMGILAYLGASRASSRANWDMVRRALDGDAGTRRALRDIARIAGAMRAALSVGDIDQAARLLAAEWEERRALSPEVSTPETEIALSAAKGAGATGGKICGAGGGGCLFILGPSAAKARIVSALESCGCRPLEFRVASRGLVLESDGEGSA